MKKQIIEFFKGLIKGKYEQNGSCPYSVYVFDKNKQKIGMIHHKNNKLLKIDHSFYVELLNQKEGCYDEIRQIIIETAKEICKIDIDIIQFVTFKQFHN